MERVVSLTVGDQHRIYPFSRFKGSGVLHDQLAGVPVVIFHRRNLRSVLDKAHILRLASDEIHAVLVTAPGGTLRRIVSQPGEPARPAKPLFIRESEDAGRRLEALPWVLLLACAGGQSGNEGQAPGPSSPDLGPWKGESGESPRRGKTHAN